MNVLFTRHEGEAQDRLNMTVDIENGRLFFEMWTSTRGCSIHGNVGLIDYRGPTELTHSSGLLTEESVRNMKTMMRLFGYLQEFATQGMNDVEIVTNVRMLSLLALDGWQLFVRNISSEEEVKDEQQS